MPCSRSGVSLRREESGQIRNLLRLWGIDRSHSYESPPGCVAHGKYLPNKGGSCAWSRHSAINGGWSRFISRWGLSWRNLARCSKKGSSRNCSPGRSGRKGKLLWRQIRDKKLSVTGVLKLCWVITWNKHTDMRQNQAVASGFNARNSQMQEPGALRPGLCTTLTD